jgi:hypothetical protein
VKAIEVQCDRRLSFCLRGSGIDFYEAVPALFAVSMRIDIEPDSATVATNTLLNMDDGTIRPFQSGPVFDEDSHQLALVNNAEPYLHLCIRDQMQTGDADVRNVQFIGAEMKRTLVAVLEFASTKFPLKGIECVIRPSRNTQLPQFIKHHSCLSSSAQY